MQLQEVRQVSLSEGRKGGNGGRKGGRERGLLEGGKCHRQAGEDCRLEVKEDRK